MKTKQLNLKPILVTILGLFAYSMVAFAGGSGTGGGNYILGTKVTADDAAHELSQIKPYVIAAFNTLDIVSHSRVNSRYGGELLQMRHILFDKKKTVFDFMRTVSVDPLQSAPCRDSAGAAKAGSVYNTKPNDICLSVQTASQELTTDNLFQQLVGIYVHEVSHKMGADENLAVFTQRLVLSMISSTSKQNYTNDKLDLQQQLRYETDAATKLTTDIDTKPDYVIAEDISSMQQDAQLIASMAAQAFDSGLIPLNKTQWAEAVLVMGRVSYTTFYYLPVGSVSGKPYYLKKSKIVPVANAYRDGGSLYEKQPDLIQVGYHDKKALRSAAQQISASAKDILNALRGAR